MQISEHCVRERAYYIWEDEGCVHGRAAEHWLRAEAELRAVPAEAPARKATRAPVRKTAEAKVAAETVVKPAAKAAKPAAPKAPRTAKAAAAASLAAKAKPAVKPGRASAALH